MCLLVRHDRIGQQDAVFRLSLLAIMAFSCFSALTPAVIIVFGLLISLCLRSQANLWLEFEQKRFAVAQWLATLARKAQQAALSAAQAILRALRFSLFDRATRARSARLAHLGIPDYNLSEKILPIPCLSAQ